jgi:PKD repeat protein
MLFVLDSAGVPSIATFVHLGVGTPNQPPSATITSPNGNMTVPAGQSVSFSGSGSDPDGTINAYSWNFPGGNPSSSAVANPGAVTYSTPGTFTASFTVTDNGGLASTPATRTITVPDFSISASPSSQTVFAGNPTTYSATVTMNTGFSGTVDLSVSGLPSGATGSFSPTSLSTSGTSTLTVSTSTSTPGGTYQLSIKGTSGNVTHTATVTLVVTGDFTISASPSSVTVSKNGIATYTVTVGALPGFSSIVTLSAAGLPKQATPKFTPASITKQGTSTFTVDTRKQVARGSYVLTIKGTSGSLTHSTTVTMVVQ